MQVSEAFLAHISPGSLGIMFLLDDSAVNNKCLEVDVRGWAGSAFDFYV